ncbi:MAG: calcium-binding protein [Paracoccus sp. (in: a-proteobacteria)]
MVRYYYGEHYQDDFIQGSSDDDMMRGRTGSDTLFGGAGNDTLYGDNEYGSGHDDDILHAGDGDDFIYTGYGTNIAYGGNGNDRLLVTGHGDSVYGGEGDDEFLYPRHYGTDDALLNGGNGDDVYMLHVRGARIVETATGGTDTAYCAYSVDMRADADNFSNIEIVFLNGNTNLNLVGNGANNRLVGNSAQNSIWGASGHDSLSGGDGNDTLGGGHGNDTVDGGAGTDKLIGGFGDDYFTWLDGLDQIVETADGGNDTVHSATMTLNLRTNPQFVNIENATAAGQRDLAVFGSSGHNKLVGNVGDNIIMGDLGNDTLTGDMGTDTFIFRRGDGRDVISDLSSPSDEKIRLLYLGVSNMTQAKEYMTEVGDDVVMDFGQGDVLTIENSTISRIEFYDNLIFV